MKNVLYLLFFSLLFQKIIAAEDSNFQKRIVEYKDNSTVLKGYLAYNPSFSSLRPAIVIVHDWNGRDEFENGKADAFAKLGYVGFALDLFGAVGKDPNENRRLIKPLADNKALFLRRLQLGMDEVTKLQFVDKKKIGAIGFCFGGSGVLEMARNRMKVSGVVSFHGGLTPSEPKSNDTITSKILVLTGHEDPGIPPSEVQEFEEEMTRKNADWQVHVYGNHTYHAFTVPSANVPGQTQYHPISDKRSWITMKNFFNEIFCTGPDC